MAKALINLLPHESKKLIAIGVTQLDWIQEKKKKGRIFVSEGTTNSYVLEELLAGKEFDKSCYVAGQIVPEGGRLTACPSEKRLKEMMLVNGKAEDVESTPKAIESLEKDDVVIKGANALDPDGVAGVLLGHPQAGTCGAIWGSIVAKGLHLLIPIGLEKLVAHSILYSMMDMGIKQIDYADGLQSGLFPLFGEVFTEVDALYTLFELEDVIHVASGGIGGAEGSVTLLVIGEDEIVKKAFEFCQKLKLLEKVKPTLKE